MTPFIWAQTADSRPLVPALRLKPSRQHLTRCLEPLTSMMIASYCTSFHTANFQIHSALMDCTTFTLAYIPLNCTTLDCDEDRIFFFFWSPPVRKRKTWLIHLAQSLTWQIIRSEGPTLHYPHNKALPAGPTRVSAKLETVFVHILKTLCHVWVYFPMTLADKMWVSPCESYLTLISNEAFKYVHIVRDMA